MSDPLSLTWRHCEADIILWAVQKANKPSIWTTMDAKTRRVMAFHVGDRCHESAKELWSKISLVSREQATFYTDQYAAYQGVFQRLDTKPSRSKPAKSISLNVSTTP